MADPTAALGQVFSTFLSYKDRQADREVRLGELERRKVADEDTAEYRANVIEQQRLDREESIRQFNLGQVAVDAETRWRDSETAINTNKEKRTAREEKAVFSFNLAQQVQFDGKNYVQYGVNGRVLNFDEEELANAIEAGNKTALSLLAQMYNDQPRTDESAGFQVTADSASTPMQRGPNGEMLRVAGGEYPDGGAGVISEEGSSASDDPPALATSLEQAKQLNSYLRNDVLSRSAYGTNLRNNVSSGLTAISSRDAALESLQADLTGDVGVALDGMATQQGTREAISMARSFKAAHANATPEEQRRMVLDMADFLELEVDPALRDAPTEIIGERGTKELGTREEIQTTGSALGGFSHTIADVPIKDTDFNESVKADRRKLTGLEGKINQTTKALDSDTLSPTEREAEQKK